MAMETRDVIELVLSIGGAIGLLAVGLGYAFGQFRQGQSNRRKDDVDSKKNVLDLLQEQVDSLETLCQKQQEEIIILRTQSEEREKKAKEYIEIFQNRNPEMITFMKYLTETATASNVYMKDTGKLFNQLAPVLEKILSHLEKNNANSIQREPELQQR